MATRIPPDGCLVPTAPLADELDRFFVSWLRDRPPTGGQLGDEEGEVKPVRAAEWLSVASGVSESTIKHIRDRRYRTTELRVADALVSALGHPELFYDGTLPVTPNPSAPREVRAACCCSGSTTTGSSGSTWLATS